MDESTSVSRSEADLLRAVARLQLARLGDETIYALQPARDLVACAARNLAMSIDQLPREQRPIGWWPLVSHRERAEILILRLRQTKQELERSEQIANGQTAVGVQHAIDLVDAAFGFSLPEGAQIPCPDPLLALRRVEDVLAELRKAPTSDKDDVEFMGGWLEAHKRVAELLEEALGGSDPSSSAPAGTGSRFEEGAVQ
jgi:hypothetical protein